MIILASAIRPGFGDFFLIFMLLVLISVKEMFGDDIRVRFPLAYRLMMQLILILFAFFLWLSIVQISRVS